MPRMFSDKLKRKRIMKNLIQVSIQEEIKAKKEELAKLREQLPKVETPQYRIEKREFNSLMLDELLTLSKTSKAVLKTLRGGLDIRTMLSEKQLERFNDGQYQILLKSPSTVVKMFTDSQKQKFVEQGNKVTPTTYLNAIIKGSTMRPETFKKRQKGK